jgi:NAD(P)H-dependent FMN reductase
MKIIAFQSSPRKGGNTDELLKSAIEGTGQEVKVYRLQGMKISPCLNCGGCEETGICVVKDDMTQIYDDIRTAERIIFASPIFFMNVSAQAKGLIDRCQSFWCEKYLLNKTIPTGPHGRKGLILLVGALEKDAGIICAQKCSTSFLRTINIQENETLKYMAVDAKGDILKHPTAIKDAFEAGQRLIL